MKTHRILHNAEILSFLPEFIDLYQDRPITHNSGGMGFNHSLATFCIAKKLSPSVIIESGVWRGHSTWVLEKACPGADLICIDPNPTARQYHSDAATYYTDDFSRIDWSDIDTKNALCFFDDHQNAYQRLQELWWWGFSRAIFEDNFPCGEGDCYSLRHVLAGFGHPRIQMSRAYRSTSVRARLKDWLEHKVLYAYHDRQSMVRTANEVDGLAIKKNLEIYQEIPPVIRYAKNNWGGEWAGHYASETPLFEEFPQDRIGRGLRELEDQMPGAMFQYGYICYIELRR